MGYIRSGILWIILGVILIAIGSEILIEYPFGGGRSKWIVTIFGVVTFIGGLIDLKRHPNIIESRERHYIKPASGSSKYTIKLTHFSWGRGSKIYNDRNSMIFDVNLSLRNSMGLLNAFGGKPSRAKSDVVKDGMGMVKYEIYREGIDMFVLKKLSNGEIFKIRNSMFNLRVYDSKNRRLFDYVYGYGRKHRGMLMNIMGEPLAKVSPKAFSGGLDVSISKDQEFRNEILVSLAILNSVRRGSA